MTTAVLEMSSASPRQLVSGSIGPHGEIILGVLKAAYDRINQSEFYFPHLAALRSELDAVFSRTNEPGWDGYDAASVSEQTYFDSMEFLRLLPGYLPAPSIGAEPDGSVSFEWTYEQNRILSVTVGPNRKLMFVYFNLEQREFGSDVLKTRFPKRIHEMIRELNPLNVP